MHECLIGEIMCQRGSSVFCKEFTLSCVNITLLISYDVYFLKFYASQGAYRISSNKRRASDKLSPLISAVILGIHTEISASLLIKASPLINAAPLNVALNSYYILLVANQNLCKHETIKYC